MTKISVYGPLSIKKNMHIQMYTHYWPASVIQWSIRASIHSPFKSSLMVYFTVQFQMTRTPDINRPSYFEAIGNIPTALQHCESIVYELGILRFDLQNQAIKLRLSK